MSRVTYSQSDYERLQARLAAQNKVVVNPAPQQRSAYKQAENVRLGRKSVQAEDVQELYLQKKVVKKRQVAPQITAICDELNKNGLGFYLEFKFHPTRKWRFDIYVPRAKTGIEYNGSQYTNGRHTRGVGYGKDLEKINTAQMQGYKVLQYTTCDFSKGGRGAYGVVEDVKKC